MIYRDKDGYRDLFRASVGFVWSIALLCGVLYVTFFILTALFA
jgi:uncharacterized membrane protein (DUF485 family)